MSSRQSSLVLAAAVVAACGPGYSQHGPALFQVAPAPGPVVVHASYAHTWDTLVQLVVRDWGFAAPQLSPASGVIQTDMVRLETWSRAQRTVAATCDRLDPDVVWLSIFARGDSARTTVEFTPRYFRWSGAGWVQCQTTGQWEQTLSDTLKARAERLPRTG